MHGEGVRGPDEPYVPPRPLEPPGEFRFDRLGPGLYRPEVVSWRDDRTYAGTSTVCAGDHGVRIDLAETGRRDVPDSLPEAPERRSLFLEIALRGSESRPVASGEAEVWQGGSRLRERAWIRDGTVRTTALDQEPTWLHVHGARTGTGERLGPAVLGPFTGETRRTVTLPPAMTIRGRVPGPDAAPVAGVAVSATLARPPNERLSLVDDRTRTDATGRFTLDGLAADLYRLRLTPSRKYAEPKPVVVRGGADGVVLRLRLRR